MIAAPDRILIIRRRAIGDCIVSMDVARALRERWPDAHIAFVVDRPAVEVVDGSEFVDEMVVYDRRDYSTGSAWRRVRATWKWLARLRELRPDLVVDLLGTPQTAIWTAWTRAATRVGPRRRQRSWAYNLLVEREAVKRFAGERFLDWVRVLGIEPGPWRPHAPVAAQKAGAGIDFDLDGRAFVLLNANATWPSRAWPAESFAALGRLLASRCEVRLAWAPGEESLRDRIVGESGGTVHALPPTSIAELGAWAARADVVVSTDSGPKHLAVAMGTRTLTFFGSTDPRGWQPAGKKHRAITNPVDCHPCDLLHCPVEGHPCLDALTPERVATEVESMLDEGVAMAERIGGIVITRNEASNIEGCLASLEFCDLRMVVDSFSSDDTVARACRIADVVVRREFVNHAEQKNWAIDQLDTEWVFILDADERVPAELAAEIRRCADEGDRDGWWILRSNWFFGRFITGAGWDRDRVLRLFRRRLGRYDDREVHEEVRMADGSTTGLCENRVAHFSYLDWASTFERFLNYSRGGARDRRRRGKAGSAGAVVFKPVARFLRQYFLDRGWRDGLHGLVLCQWAAAGVFLRETRLLVEDDGHEVVNRGPHRPPRVECAKGQLRTGSPDDPAAPASAGE